MVWGLRSGIGYEELKARALLMAAASDRAAQALDRAVAGEDRPADDEQSSGG
jgi:hypothetical protein